MYRRSFVMSNFDKNTFLRLAFALIWIAGLSLGVFTERFYGEAFRACLLLAPHQIPSWIGTMCVNVLPLLISAYAVSFIPSALYALCLLRGFLLGVGISAVAALFGNAGSMMCVLLLFSLFVYGPVLFWYWLRTFQKNAFSFIRDTGVCLAIAIAVSLLDWGVISPFLVEILTF